MTTNRPAEEMSGRTVNGSNLSGSVLCPFASRYARFTALTSLLAPSPSLVSSVILLVPHSHTFRIPFRHRSPSAGRRERRKGNGRGETRVRNRTGWSVTPGPSELFHLPHPFSPLASAGGRPLRGARREE